MKSGCHRFWTSASFVKNVEPTYAIKKPVSSTEKKQVDEIKSHAPDVTGAVSVFSPQSDSTRYAP